MAGEAPFLQRHSPSPVLGKPLTFSCDNTMTQQDRLEQRSAAAIPVGRDRRCRITFA
jgi:hypothetical protein